MRINTQRLSELDWHKARVDTLEALVRDLKEENLTLRDEVAELSKQNHQLKEELNGLPGDERGNQ